MLAHDSRCSLIFLLNEQVITASIVDMIMKLEADRMPEDWDTAFERETQREILDELLQDLPWPIGRPG